MKKVKKLSLKKIKVAAINYKNEVRGGVGPDDFTFDPIYTFLTQCNGTECVPPPAPNSNNTCHECNASGGVNGNLIVNCATTTGGSDTCYTAVCL